MVDQPKIKAKMQEVLDTYLAMKEPNIERSLDVFLDENRHKTISLTTVKRWAARYKWVEKALEKNPGMKHSGHTTDKHPKGKPHKVRQAEARKTPYEDDIKLATPETIKALQGKILDKMHTELDLLHLDTTDKYADMLALVGKMQQLEHEFRGAKFTGSDEAVSGDDTEDLPESSPVVDFKKVSTRVRNNKT